MTEEVLCVTPTEPMAQGDGPPPKALRERCMTALAAVSTQPTVIRESAPVLLEVLVSSHTGNQSGCEDGFAFKGTTDGPCGVGQASALCLPGWILGHGDSAPPPGTGSFAVDDALAACRSLQRIVEQAPDVEDTGRFFHDIIIPRLLGLALQAGLWRKYRGGCTESLFYWGIPQDCHWVDFRGSYRNRLCLSRWGIPTPGKPPD